MTEALKLRAETSDDLEVFSAALQDAITRVGDIRFDSNAHALTMRFTRFRHESKSGGERVLSGCRVDGVLALKSKGINRSDPEGMAVLLSIEFTPGQDAPGGVISFIFAGGGELQAEAECIDMTLADVSEPRKTDKRPLHPVDE